MLQQKRKEEEALRKQAPVFSASSEYAPPFHEDHYYELPQKHKDQTVYSHIPGIRRKFNGERDDFDALPREQRFSLYEMIMLGKVTSLWEEIERIKAKKKCARRIRRSESRKINEILDLLEADPKLRAHDLISVLPKKIFSRLMLYVKYAGDNPDSIRRFFENLEKC